MNTLALAITGSGGSGVITAGTLLLEAAHAAGFYGWMMKSFGPQIRGGESAAMLYLADAPIEHPLDAFDLLAGLDWKGFERFADELPMADEAPVWHDEGHRPPELLSGLPHRALPLHETARRFDRKGRFNLVAAGALAAELGLPLSAVTAAAARLFARKGEAVVQLSMRQIEAGFDLVDNPTAPMRGWHRSDSNRWVAAGNPLTGLGLLRAGIRFVSAYPITPATDLLEWLAPRLPALGGTLIQAEDELAAVNMAIGARFAGVPAATATSGPGFSLMVEGIGLAIAAEIPLTLVNVNRGGPSTGIPTKSEQSDLESLLFAPHGDSPHIVTAPLGIHDLAATAQWSAWLAEHLQTVAIMASEQRLATASAIIDPVADRPDWRTPAEPVCAEGGFLRFDPDRPVNPLPVPGRDACRYVADGLEHDPRGVPSSFASDHQAQLDRRARKLNEFDYGEMAFELTGDPADARLLIGFGSSVPALKEAARRLNEAGMATAVLGLRLLNPLPVDSLCPILAAAARCHVVEQTHSGQLTRHLRGQLPEISFLAHARPGPLPLRPGELVEMIEEAS